MRQWQKEKFMTAINHLRSYCSTVECLHNHYSAETLKKEVAGIKDSIEFLESMLSADCYILLDTKEYEVN